MVPRASTKAGSSDGHTHDRSDSRTSEELQGPAAAPMMPTQLHGRDCPEPSSSLLIWAETTASVSPPTTGALLTCGPVSTASSPAFRDVRETAPKGFFVFFLPSGPAKGDAQCIPTNLDPGAHDCRVKGGPDRPTPTESICLEIAIGRAVQKPHQDRGKK